VTRHTKTRKWRSFGEGMRSSCRSSVETVSAAGPPDCFRNEKRAQYSCTNLHQCIYNKYTRRSSCSSISPTWIRLVVTVQPGCTNLGLGTLFHSKPMPAITAALVEATVGQRLNPNRAWQPFAHASIVGEHKAKVNSAPRFLAIGDCRRSRHRVRATWKNAARSRNLRAGTEA
jgi:hypothetical protein